MEHCAAGWSAMNDGVSRWRRTWRRTWARRWEPVAAGRDGLGTGEAIPEVPSEVPSASVENSISKQQQQLVRLHYQLMAVYVYAVNTARGPNWLPRGKEPPRKKQPWVAKLESRYRRRPPTPESGQPRVHSQVQRFLFKSRPITRALVESHIKAKLTELRTTYAEMEQFIPDDSSVRDFRTWIKDTQDSLARFSATLATLVVVRRTLKALWPLVIALVVVGAIWDSIRHLLGKVTHNNLALDLGLIGVVAIAVILYVMMGLFLAAAKKRSFFLAPVSVSRIWNSNIWAPGPGKPTVGSIYEAEDELFACIGKPKRLEPPLDMYAYSIMALCLAVLVFAATFIIKSSAAERIYLSVLAIISLALIAIARQRVRRRNLR